MRLNGQRDFDHATSWVLSCCVLHNICRQMEDLPLDCADAVGPDEAWVEPGASADVVRNTTMEKVCSVMRANGTYRSI